MSLRKNVLYNENAELDISFLDNENIPNIFYSKIEDETRRIPKITDQLYLELACSNFDFIPKVCNELKKRSEKFKDMSKNERKNIALNFFGRLINEDELKILVYEILLLNPECDKGKFLKNIGFNMDNSNLIENIISKLDSYGRNDEPLKNLGFDFLNKDTIKLSIVSLFEDIAISELLKEINESEKNRVLLNEILSRLDVKEKNNVAKKLEEILANLDNFNNSMENLEKSYNILEKLKNIHRLKNLKIEINKIKKLEEQIKEIKDEDFDNFLVFIFKTGVTNLLKENYDGVREEQKKRRIVFALWHYDYCRKIIPTERKTINYIIEDIKDDLKVDIKEEDIKDNISKTFYENTLLIIQDILQDIVGSHVKKLDKKLQNFKKDKKNKTIENISKVSIKKELKNRFNTNSHIINLTNKYFEINLKNIIVRELIFQLGTRNNQNKIIVKELLDDVFNSNLEKINYKLDYIVAICKEATRKTEYKKYSYDKGLLDKVNNVTNKKININTNIYSFNKLIKKNETLINDIIDDYFRISEKDITDIVTSIKEI